MSKEKWSFVHVTDIHLGSPKSFYFQPSQTENWHTACRQIGDINPDLLLVGGDITENGGIHRYELEEGKEALDTLQVPYHVVPGNMDTGNKWTGVSGNWRNIHGVLNDDKEWNIQAAELKQWEEIFGRSNWSFVHKGVRFSGFCDMLLGSGLPEEELLWRWLEAQTQLPPAKHHVWVMHSPLFMEELHEPNWDITNNDEYINWYFGIDNPQRNRLMEIFKASGATVVISGHVHVFRTFFAEGIRFDIGPSTAFSQYAGAWPGSQEKHDGLGFLKYDVDEEKGLSCNFVKLEEVSTAEGYGLGGHVPHELRDYSIAWEPGGDPDQQ